MCHNLALSCQPSAFSEIFEYVILRWLSPPKDICTCLNSQRLLLLRSTLFRSRLLRSSRLLLRSRLRGLGFSLRLRSFFSFLFRFGFFLRKLRRSELLAIESDLSDSHRAERLPMSSQLLVLLLPLVVEDDNFLAAAFAENFAGHQGTRSRTRNLPFAGRDCQHVAKFNLAVLRALRLKAQHIAGRHSILFSTCADHRVHSYASVCRQPKCAAAIVRRFVRAILSRKTA